MAKKGTKSTKKTTTTKRTYTRRSSKKDNTLLYGIIFIIVLAITVGILMMCKSPKQKIEAILNSKTSEAEKKYNLTKKSDIICDDEECEYTVTYYKDDKDIATSVFYTSDKEEFNDAVKERLEKELIKIEEFTGKDKKKYYLVTLYQEMSQIGRVYLVLNESFVSIDDQLKNNDTAIKGYKDENAVWLEKDGIHYLTNKLGEYKTTVNNNKLVDDEFVKFHDSNKVEAIGEEA